MLKDHGHDLFNDRILLSGEGLLWWVGCGNGGDSVGGVLCFNSFARVILSSLVIIPFCSSSSPMASSSYIESIDISTNVNNVLGSTGSGIRVAYRAARNADNGRSNP